MRILHISTRLILGGSQENTVLSCEGQACLGHQVHLAFGPIYGPEGSLLRRVEAFVAPDGGRIATHVVPDLVRQVSPGKDYRAYRTLRRLIEDLRPDVVHTHSSKAGIVGRAAAWNARPRPAVVHTIHGPPFMPVEGSLVRRLKIRLSNYQYTLAERFAARRCHRIVSVADAMTRQFLARGIGRPERYVTIRSGMEVAAYLSPAPGEERQAVRASLGIAPDEFVIGTVARLAEHKGHDALLDALADDLRDRPRWRLLWVGDGWWRDRLLARVAGLGLQGRVITTGLVSQERVPGLVRAMDLLVHPSAREGLPRTVPQAMLAGVPVVATDVDGTREVCLDPADVGPERATGRLVPLGDLAALRDAVRWMADNPEPRRAMARQGRDWCALSFDAVVMVAELEKIYAQTRS